MWKLAPGDQSVDGLRVNPQSLSDLRHGQERILKIFHYEYPQDSHTDLSA
jgi:hypothetical protein